MIKNLMKCREATFKMLSMFAYPSLHKFTSTVRLLQQHLSICTTGKNNLRRRGFVLGILHILQLLVCLFSIDSFNFHV